MVCIYLKMQHSKCFLRFNSITNKMISEFMKTLSENWLTEEHIDFEYKQYVLLAWLNGVEKEFEKKHLYPFLSELIEHYRKLKRIKENASAIYHSFPNTINAIDLQNFTLSYKKVIENDEIMKELEQIIDFSIPHFERHLKEGKALYDYLEKQISVESVGLIPLNKECGYMLIQVPKTKDLRVFEFTISLYENNNERYRGIHSRFIASYTQSISMTPEKIKVDLIDLNRFIPNPATYYFSTEQEVPFDETMLPISKRLLMKKIAAHV